MNEDKKDIKTTEKAKKIKKVKLFADSFKHITDDVVNKVFKKEIITNIESTNLKISVPDNILEFHPAPLIDSKFFEVVNENKANETNQLNLDRDELLYLKNVVASQDKDDRRDAFINVKKKYGW